MIAGTFDILNTERECEDDNEHQQAATIDNKINGANLEESGRSNAHPMSWIPWRWKVPVALRVGKHSFFVKLKQNERKEETKSSTKQ